MQKPQKIIWIILDAAGYEIASRCLRAGVCPSLSRIQAEGYLGPSRPSAPNCETPAALRALFAGAEPAQSGIWGFQMPRYGRRLHRSISGFSVRASGPAAIWEELERRGQGYTLFNAAFRKDPVWDKHCRHFDLLVDGYRNYKYGQTWIRLEEKKQTLDCRGVRLGIDWSEGSLSLRRGRKNLAVLLPGEIRTLQLSRKVSALFYCTDDKLFVFPCAKPHIRVGRSAIGTPESLLPDLILHGNLFREARSNNDLSLEEEMRLCELVTAQISEMTCSAIEALPSRLFITYFPLIDELSHVYLDRIADQWPQGRASELARRCFGLLDACIGRIMEQSEQGTLIVVSSDHGQVPYRRVLHFNSLLAEIGLVRKSRKGYDLGRSVAFYHPANCGQVLVNRARANKAGLSLDRIREKVVGCLEKANALGADLGYQVGGASDPYLLFVYPRADTHITGKGKPKDELLDASRNGGQHLSPLAESPWIQALLGLWSPGGLPFAREDIPDRNTGMKDFLLRYLFED